MSITLLPANPFIAFTPLLLPAESSAILTGAQTVIEATAPDVQTPLLENARAIVTAAGLKELPQGISAQRLGDYFQAAAQMLGGDRARTLQRASSALTRLVSTDPCYPKGISALMAAGAGVMQGSTPIPSLWGGVGEPVVEGILAYLDVPAEWWWRLREHLSNQTPTPDGAGWLHYILGNQAEPGNDGFSISPKVRDGDTGRMRISVQKAGGDQLRLDDIEAERAKAVLLGLKYAVGLLPWSGLGFAPVAPGGKVIFPDRTILSRGGVTVVLEGMPDIVAGLDRPPPSVVSLGVNLPVVQRDGESVSSYLTETMEDLGGGKKGYNTQLVRRPAEGALDRYPWKKSVGLQAVRETFRSGVNWSNPVINIAAKIGRLASENRRVIVRPAGKDGWFGVRKGRQVFDLSTDRGRFYLVIANGDDPKKRYAAVGMCDVNGPAYYYKQGLNSQENCLPPWHLIVGPEGNLGFLTAELAVAEGERQPPGQYAHVRTAEYWPDALAQLPIAWALIGAVSNRHPLSIVYDEVPADDRMRMFFKRLRYKIAV